MGGTRIFVLQMKHLIRTAIFAAIALILIIVLAVLFIPRQSGETANGETDHPAGASDVSADASANADADTDADADASADADEQPGVVPALYAPGTYSSSIILNDKPVDVVVTVTDNAITKVELANMVLVQRVFYPLFEPVMADISQAVLDSQAAGTPLETEYPVTASILQKAIEAALAQATP